MAHIKAGGTTRTNKDSVSKRLGVKLFGGQLAKVGNIIIRQKGTKYHSGPGTKLGHDYTIYAMTEGKVKFYFKQSKQFVSVEA